MTKAFKVSINIKRRCVRFEFGLARRKRSLLDAVGSSAQIYFFVTFKNHSCRCSGDQIFENPNR